jgi:hypothetical protein
LNFWLTFWFAKPRSFTPADGFGCTSILTTTTEALLLEELQSPTSIVHLTATPITVAAPQIVVEWKSEDLSLFNPASSSALFNSTSSPAPSATQTPQNSHGSPSLSSGTKAGIIMAAVGAFVLIIGISFS